MTALTDSTPRLPGPLASWGDFNPRELPEDVMAFQAFRDHHNRHQGLARTVYQRRPYVRRRAFQNLLSRLQRERQDNEKTYGYIALLGQHQQVYSVLGLDRMAFMYLIANGELKVDVPQWQPRTVAFPARPLCEALTEVPSAKAIQFSQLRPHPQRPGQQVWIHDEAVQPEGGAPQIARVLAGMAEVPGSAHQVQAVGEMPLLTKPISAQDFMWLRAHAETIALMPGAPRLD